MTASKYPLHRIRILSAHHPDLDSYWPQLRKKILPLRPETHCGEHGASPTGIQAWMDFHNFPLAGQINPVFGTRVAIDPTTGIVLGMGTLVVDDRGVSAEMLKEFGIEATGCWGGFYMFNQGVGIGGHLCRYVDQEIQFRVNESLAPETWILFTANPIAVKIYTRLGFRLVKKEHYVQVFNNHEDVYVKVYEPER